MNTKYLFVIDTDSYTGNFEREMTAYLTGLHNYTHGEEEAVIAIDEISKELNDFVESCHVGHVDEEHGWGVAEILNNGSKNDPASVAIAFNEEPGTKLIAEMKERAYKFVPYYQSKQFGGKIKIKGFRLITRKTMETSEKI